MITDNKKETVKVGALVFISAFLGKLVSIPSNVVVASILGPAEFGVLAVAQTIIQYAGYSSLGMLMNMTREVPISYGQKRLSDVRLTYNVIFTNYTITTLVAVSILWILPISGFDFGGDLGTKVYLILTLVILSSNSSSFLNAYLKAEGKFIIYGQFEIVSKVILPLSTLVLAYFFSLEGVLISLFIGNLIGFLFIYIKSDRPKFQLHLNLFKSKELFRTGIPMFISKVLEGVLLSIGVIITTLYFDKPEIGIFSFAIALIAVKKIPFAKVFSVTINRKMGLDAGEFGIEDKVVFRKYFERTFIMFLLLCTLVIGLAFLLYDKIVELFLHKYEDSIPLMLIFFSVIVFYNARIFINNYLNITNQMIERIKILVIGLIVAVIASIWLIQLDNGLVGVVIGIALAYMVISTRLIILTFNQVFGKDSGILMYFMKIGLISIVLTALLYFLEANSIFSVPRANEFNYYMIVLLELILKIIVFGLVCSTLFMGLFSSYGVYKETRSIVTYYLLQAKTKTTKLIGKSY